jgi:hypothetical protein
MLEMGESFGHIPFQIWNISKFATENWLWYLPFKFELQSIYTNVVLDVGIRNLVDDVAILLGTHLLTSCYSVGCS